MSAHTGTVPERAGGAARAGGYRIVRRLGAGGMGTVFLAVDRRDRPVALKVLHEHLRHDPLFRRTFAREMDAARRVTGPGTARVLDADPDGPVPYLVTEYVEGMSLHDRVVGHGPLAGPGVHAVAAGVAVALTTIHGSGVVHRDLKPRNVMLSPHGPKVIDFGVAGAVGRDTGVGMGTPGWLAPEQLAGEAGGTAADVYAWGLIVAWSATGIHPSQEPPDLGALPAALVPAVRAALARDPADRPSAHELVAALQSIRAQGQAPVTSIRAQGQAPVTDGATRRLPGGDAARRVPGHGPTRPTRATRPTRRAGRRRYLHRVAAVLLAAGLLVAGWHYAGRYIPGTTAQATSGGAPEPTAQPTVTAAPAPKPKPPAPAPAPAGGPTVRDGGLAFTLTGVHCGDTDLGTWPTRKHAVGQFCLLDVRVDNIGDRAGFVFLGSQRLVDRTGKEYPADDWSWVYYAQSRPFTSTLDAGQSVSGTMVFDTPPGLTFTQLVVHDTPLSRGTPLVLP